MIGTLCGTLRARQGQAIDGVDRLDCGRNWYRTAAGVKEADAMAREASMVALPGGEAARLRLISIPLSDLFL
jgi:hypothetical protein